PSSAVDFVRPVTACLVDVYGEELGRGAWAEMEPLLMMRPPRGCWSFMILIASCVQRKVPVRLVSTTAFHCSYVRSSIGLGGPPRPALLTNTSRRPTSRLVRAKRSRTAAGSPTSEGTASVFAPLASSATASSISLRRPDRTTAYPSRASASAADLPTPDPAPVTS